MKMKFYKILSFTNVFKQPDYKGLNLDFTVLGSQVIKKDMSFCLIATTDENTVEHPDLTELTQDQYIAERQVIDAENQAEIVTTEQKITQLETQNTQVLNQLNLLPPVTNPTTLQDFQQNKIYELNMACNQDILNGFTSSVTGVSHQYKFDMEYQANFAQTGMMLALDPTIASVDWPTKDAGVITHTRDQFIQLLKEAKTLKESKLYRYFGMKAQVLSATTIEEVNVFVW